MVKSSGLELAGEQYENDPYKTLPMSDGNIDDRRGQLPPVQVPPDPLSTTEANTARTMASMRTRRAVKGRQRAP